MGGSKAPIDEALTALEAFDRSKLDDLQPLAVLVADDAPKRKTELVPFLVKIMTTPVRVRELYERLDAMARNAVRIATFDLVGRLDREKFHAQFGELPQFETIDPDQEKRRSWHSDRGKPTLLRLFFPRYDHLPTDTREILRDFVPAPEPFTIPTLDVLPTNRTLKERVWTAKGSKSNEWDVPLQIRETPLEVDADLRAVLRLIDSGKVRVTDKKLVPTETTRQTMTSVLAGGDFYVPDDASKEKYDPFFDIAIKAFAWPVLVQAGGLAEKSGETLKLTAAGKRALTAPTPEVVRKLWNGWLKTRQFDEFARVEAIKGQGRARMSRAANRRQVVIDALAACPVGRWFAIDDLFRFLRATGREFAVTQSPHVLYIAEHNYGNLGYDSEHAWEQLQGRFVMAFLFEYAATLGVIDVAYIPPQHVRQDYKSRWGADDLSCLSRYDGLLYLRVNPLGAWLLGNTDKYHPPAPKRTDVLKVLSNMDIVAARPLSMADRLTIERFADPASEGVWKLSAERILGVVEQGGSVAELEQFLALRTAAELPATVTTFLGDLRTKAGRLTDAGPARLIACADEHLAAELAADRQLKGKCLRAGDRFIVVRDTDLDLVRKVVRRLGYVWPVPPA